jgi:hypothetical protein
MTSKDATDPNEAPATPPQAGDALGGRAGLPAGSLSKPNFGPQGDEHRDPPEVHPAPSKPEPGV